MRLKTDRPAATAIANGAKNAISNDVQNSKASRECQGLLDDLEMSIENTCFSVVDALRAWGYSERVAWATVAAGRDGMLAVIEAAERRLHQIAVREAQAEIARQQWRKRQGVGGGE